MKLEQETFTRNLHRITLNIGLNSKIHYTSFPIASPQQVRNISDKSVTSWRRQKSVVSVVSCRFPNSITTTCYQLLFKQQVGRLRGNVCNGFWASVRARFFVSDPLKTADQSNRTVVVTFFVQVSPTSFMSVCHRSVKTLDKEY